jgi:general secretion pathway protein I
MLLKNSFKRDRGHLTSGPCEGGFTLLEVLVALAVLSIALVAVFELFSANLKGIAASDDYVSAVLRAESKMREILDDDKLTEKSWGEATDDGYRMDATVADAATDRTENLQVKLLEITLTVHWTRGTKERSLTLKTMKLVEKQV